MLANSNGALLQPAGTFRRGHYGRVAKPHMSNKVANIFSQATVFNKLLISESDVFAWPLNRLALRSFV